MTLLEELTMRSSISPAILGLAVTACVAMCGAATADDPNAANAPSMQSYDTRVPAIEANWNAGSRAAGYNAAYGNPSSWGQPGCCQGTAGYPYYDGYYYNGAPYYGGYYYDDEYAAYYDAYYNSVYYSTPYRSAPYYASYSQGVDVLGAVHDAADHAHDLAKTFLGAPVVLSNPYTYYWGHGFYRFSDIGHIPFPHYSYRFPFYLPGHPILVRTMNVHW
jgi:hypothetical protein